MTSPLESLSSPRPSLRESEQARQQPLSHQPPHIPDTLCTTPTKRSVSPDFTPSKPILPELHVIRSMEKLHNAGARQFQVHADEFDTQSADLDKLLVQNAQALKEKCERTQSNSYWDTLRKVGAAILATVSTFLGISIFSAGGSTLIGGALVASGIMSLANLVLTEVGLWQWVAEQIAADNQEQQEKIATLIPCVVGFMACAAGFAGFGAFAYWGTLTTAPRLISIAQTAANLGTLAATIGGEVSQALVSCSQAGLTELQGKLLQHGFKTDHFFQNLEGALQREAQTHRLARQLLNLSIQTKQAILA